MTEPTTTATMAAAAAAPATTSQLQMMYVCAEQALFPFSSMSSPAQELH